MTAKSNHGYSLIHATDSMVYFNRDIRHNPNGPLYLLSSKHHKHAHYADSNVFLPRSKDEIAWIVKSVAEAQRVSKRGGGRSRRIRVIGSGHSWSSIAKSDDIQISLENYKVHNVTWNLIVAKVF